MEALKQILLNTEFQTLIVGAISAFLVQLAKKIQSIPLSDGQTKALRLTNLGIVFVGTVTARISNGTLSDTSFITNVAYVIVQTAASYLVAHVTYKSVISNPNSSSNK